MVEAFSAGEQLVTGEHANIRPPQAVLEIVQTLRRAGFESWCVGGAVRDALLGHLHLDRDLATSATPPQVRRQAVTTSPASQIPRKAFATPAAG